MKCFVCDPEGRENFSVAVASGQCAWCGWNYYSEEWHFLSIEVSTGEYKHFKVPKEVYIKYKVLELKYRYGFDENKFRENIKSITNLDSGVELSTQEFL